MRASSRSSAMSWRSNARISRSSPCRLLTAVVVNGCTGTGRSPQLFRKGIPCGVAFGDDRPDTEAAAEGLDARELPMIVELHEPIHCDDRLRLSGDIEDDAGGRILEPAPIDAQKVLVPGLPCLG